MALVNIVNNKNILLINDSFKCLTFHSKGFLVLKDVMGFDCGRAELTIKVSSNLPPLIFFNSYFPVVVESMETINVDRYGTTYRFTILGSDIGKAFEYYLFTSPNDITNEKIGTMALWDERGNKIFDSAHKYMSIIDILTLSVDQQGSSYGMDVCNIDPNKNYAFTNGVRIGFDYFYRWATFLYAICWRHGCYINRDKTKIEMDIISVYNDFAEGLENVPSETKKSFALDGMMIIIDVTNY